MSAPGPEDRPAALFRLTSPAGLTLAFVLSLTAGLGASFAADRLTSHGEVLRGVFLGDVALSGLTEADARARVSETARSFSTRPLDITLQQHTLTATLGAIGVGIDVDPHVRRAMRAGRDGSWLRQVGWWLRRLWAAEHLTLEATVDEETLAAVVEHWEAEHVRPRAFSGSLVIDDSQVVAEYPTSGYVVDRDALGQALRDRVTTAESGLEVPLRPERAALDRKAVDDALETAQRLLAGPIRLAPPPLPAPEPEPDASKVTRRKKTPRKREPPPQEPLPPAVVFRPEDLAKAIETRVIPEPPALRVSLSAERVRERLDEFRDRVEIPSRSASFDVDRRGEITVVPSSIGRAIDDDRVVEALFTLASGSSREGTLPMIQAPPPDLSTEEAETLGIDRLVSRFTTYHQCCQPRVENIHRIADLIDGVVVRPGARFSVNELLGPRTAQNGFVMAPTIVEGDMEKTVGGGISQFATTLFNAVLDGGYEIIQRQPHSYYFPRYPVGHEATLSFPSPDLIFRNDTKSGLVIKTEYGKKFIRVLIYGNNGARKVKRRVGPHIDRVDPPLEYVPNAEIPPNAAKLVSRGVAGWSVIVSRVVSEPDGAERTQRRKVTYNPKPRVVQVHPCNIPEGEPGYTGEDCPEPELPDGGSDESVPAGLVPLEGLGR